MALSETSICNQALARFGDKRINNFETDTTPRAIWCREFYEPTRDALLRSHKWRFAAARVTLVQDTTDPDFEWDNQFILPNDFMAMRSIYENSISDENLWSYAIEGQRLLTNDSTMEIRYTRKVTDPTEFDPLFVKLLVLELELQLVGPLAGNDEDVREAIRKDIAYAMPAIRAMDAQETNTIGQYGLETWNDARYT